MTNTTTTTTDHRSPSDTAPPPVHPSANPPDNPPNWGHGERCMCVPCIEHTEDWLRDRGELVIGRTTNGLLYLAATDDRRGHSADRVRTVEIGD